MSTEILPLIHSTAKLYLSGPFGSGKSTLAIERIRWLLRRERTRGDDVLVLTPQRTLGRPYYEALYTSGKPPAGPPVQITTVAGLARNAVALYWPLIASAAGFAPGSEPNFLNLETAQYHMAQFVDAALDAGEFDGVRVERSRVISQVLDNLNKAALQEMTVEEAYERLELAVPAGDQRVARLNALRAARQISQKFRVLCHEEALIDFSMMVELFNKQVLVNDWSRTHLFRSHKHLIFDNVEEDNISAHKLARLWLPHLESALIIADDDAGFRLFLGADPIGGYALADACQEQIHLDHSYVNTHLLVALAERVKRVIGIGGRGEGEQGGKGDGESQYTEDETPTANSQQPTANPFIIPNQSFRFYPQMIGWVVDEVKRLVRDEGIAPNEIALLAPFVSDALRFSLQTGLEKVGIVSTTHRPSRELQAEPAARCMLTLAKLAHPDWGVRPTASDVAQTITLAIASLDPVRASLLTRIVYPEHRRTIELGRFGELNKEAQQRITYTLGEGFDRLREWLYAYRAAGGVSEEQLPLDQFFARLFGELLSQPGYGFHDDFDGARVANQLVESARNFRWALEGQTKRQGDKVTGRQGDNSQFASRHSQLGREYVRLVESGAIGALFAAGWKETEDAVLIAPAYTYMLRNRSVRVQFWLDIGSGGWWERLYQPLTHPYVLSPRWTPGQVWSDFDEFKSRQETMQRLMLGLIRRTQEKIYVGVSEYSENGIEQRGPLLMLVNRLLVDGQ